MFTSEIISPFVDVSSLTCTPNKLDVQVRSFQAIKGSSAECDSWKERIIDIEKLPAGDPLQQPTIR